MKLQLQALNNIQSAVPEARFGQEVRKTARIVQKLVALVRSDLNNANVNLKSIDQNQQLSNCLTDLYETFTATCHAFPNHKQIETI
jgi:hypothetical protein